MNKKYYKKLYYVALILSFCLAIATMYQPSVYAQTGQLELAESDNVVNEDDLPQEDVIPEQSESEQPSENDDLVIDDSVEEEISEEVTGSNELDETVSDDIREESNAWITPITVSSDAKPKIDLMYMGTTPVNPMQGAELEVTYKLTPHPFQHNISKPKEIVLVLDVSGSMDKDSKLTNMKTAAQNFIDKLVATNVDNVTPKVSNLKIGIISYSNGGVITQDLLSVTSSDAINKNNITTLKNKIKNLSANGGTNIGDGLRKAAYLLDKSEAGANKTVVFMADGEPTYHSTNKKNSNTDYYTLLDDKNPTTSQKPYRSGSGSSDKDNYSLNYAKKIGEIIKSKKYNIFSIGYGLGNENTDANKKMKQIHQSMGGAISGENNTFFATDSGAIDTVFDKIADVLEKSYAFNDAQLDLSLPKHITVGSGLTADNKFGFEPIVYELGENNWYHAEPQIIKFKLSSSAVGDVNLFDTNSKLTYTDIFGNKVEIPIESPIVNIRPYEPSQAEKIQVDFQAIPNGYLIGDTINGQVTLIPPSVSGITFSEAKFNLNTDQLPSHIKLTPNEPILNFGTVNSTLSKDYKLKINNAADITAANYTQYDLNGSYSYKIKKGTSSTTDSGEKTTSVRVKRGQVKVKVVDDTGQDITNLSTVSIKSNTLNEINGVYSDGYLLFDTLPSGNYELLIKDLPAGCEPSEEGNNAKVMLNYDNNVAEYIFKVVGSYNTNKVTIQVKDSSGDIDHLYKSYESLIQDNVLNHFNQEYNLYGDAFANIKLEGDRLNHIKYQIVKSEQTPEFPEANWLEYTVGKDGEINDDIDLDNKGNLTQKSYNVSHLPNLTGNAQWSDREQVFQNPFDETKYKPTTVATNKDQYVTKVEYIDENGNPAVRWETNCIFTNNQSISGDYKEATKSWGYFKPPTTGYYEFKTYTDDGMKATLTLEDKSQFVIVDEFYPRGAGNGVVSKSRVFLEADKFYPIFIEYFNWGGSAAFKYEYRVSDTASGTNAKFETVPSDAFYPSKSKNPGEGGNNSFVGQSGVKFPEQIGKYYIMYKAGFIEENGTNFDESMRGIYGPFNVEDRFVLTRNMTKEEPVKQGDKITLEYIISPRDIKVTDLYKTEEQLNGTLKEQLTVTDLKFKDIIPSELNVLSVDGGTIFDKYVTNTDAYGNTSLEGPINGNMTYQLNVDSSNLSNSVYRAEAIIIFVTVQAQKDGMVNFDHRNGTLLYKDVTLESDKQGAMKESYFNATEFEIEPSSEIIKHGYFTNKPGKDFINETEKVSKVVKDANYTFGMTMDIKASTSTFEIALPTQVKNANVILDGNSVTLYELNEDESMNKQTKLKIPATNVNLYNNTINSNVPTSLIKLDKGKKYLVTYSVKFTEDTTLSSLQATLQSMGKVDIYSRPIDLELMQNKDENGLSLPDLL